MPKEQKSLAERFEEKVIPEPMSGCWLWTGALSGGYGRIGIGSRSDGSRTSVLATRVSYELFRGKIPDGLGVLHTCDNKACVNPDHLYTGTHSQNMQDAYDRGLKFPNRGPRRTPTKLTAEQIRDVRSSSRTVRELAQDLGASTHYISGIRSGRLARYGH